LALPALGYGGNWVRWENLPRRRFDVATGGAEDVLDVRADAIHSLAVEPRAILRLRATAAAEIETGLAP
jgi:hypothetical protein